MKVHSLRETFQASSVSRPRHRCQPSFLKASVLAMPALLAIAAVVPVGNAELAAQTAAEEPVSQGNICLQQSVKGGDLKGRSFVIAVPQDKADEFIARGFVAVPCRSVSAMSQAQKASHCRAANNTTSIISLFLWQNFSFTRSELCRVITGFAPADPAAS